MGAVTNIRVKSKSFPKKSLISISIVRFADFARNTHSKAGVVSLNSRGLMKTNQRVSKASLALLTKVFEIFFLGKFERFWQAARSSLGHLLLGTSRNSKRLTSFSTTASDYFFSANSRHSLQESVVT